MERYSKILITLNVVLVILNISLLAILYSDRSSVGSQGLVAGSESTTTTTEHKEAQQREQKVRSSSESSNERSAQAASAIKTNKSIADSETQDVVADIGVGAENQPAIDTIKPSSTNDERAVTSEQADAAVSFKDTYTSTKEKLEALLVTGNYQQGS